MLKRRKAGGSAFGLALLLALVFGAFAASGAQAAPKWHLLGETLAERGISSENITMQGGTLTLPMANGLTLECTNKLSLGKIEGENKGSLQLKAENCNISKSKACTVKPFTVNMLLGLTTGGKTGVIETLTPETELMATVVVSGGLCTLPEKIELRRKSGSLGAEVGPEGKPLALTGLSTQTIKAAFYGEGDMSLTGSITERPENPNMPLGAW